MSTLNLKQIGGLVKIEDSTQPGVDIYLNVSGTRIKFIQPQDGTTTVTVVIGADSYILSAITDIQVNGTPVTDQADFETQIATVFPEANSSSGGTATLPILQSPDDTLWLIGVNDAGVLITTQVAEGTPTTLNIFSPDNTEWEVTVDNDGALTTTEV